MPRHRRPAPPVASASLAVGMLGAAVLGGAAAPPTDLGTPVAAAVSPLPDATLPAPVVVRPREAITDLGF